MRLRTMLTSAIIAGLVTAGAVAGPASAGTGSASDPALPASVTVKVKNINNKKGKSTVKKFLTVDVVVPGTFTDTFSDGSPAGTKDVWWSVEVRSTGKGSCGGSYGDVLMRKSEVDGPTGGSWTIDLPIENTRKGFTNYYLKSGTCKLTAKLDVYRSTINPAGSIDKEITATTSFKILNATTVSKPAASRTTVKKNAKVALSGKATYLRADQKVYYKTKAMKKGTKLVLQQKVKGSSKWKNVKKVKVGSSGRWKTTVKVKKTTSYRVVFKETSTLRGDVSSVRTVKVKR